MKSPVSMSLRSAVLVVTAVTCAVAAGVSVLLPVISANTPGALARHLAFALSAQFALIAYFRLRARALSPAITEARLQALQARIRPHFLFNSINAVLSLIRSEPQRAEAALEDMRSSVDQWPQITAAPALLRLSCANHARNPAGVLAGPRFSRNSIVSPAVQ